MNHLHTDAVVYELLLLIGEDFGGSKKVQEEKIKKT